MGEEALKKILVVDTDPVTAGDLSAFFNSKGYSAQNAVHYQTALASVQSWKPDLVVLNVLNQRSNPLEFLASVKNNPFTETQKVLVFSKDPKTDLVAGPAPEVRAYLTKPLDFEALKAALAAAVPRPDKDRTVSVLAADDDEEFSDLIKMFLESNDYRPVIVNDPLRVVSAIRAEKPDAVILDIIMPKKDGLQILAQLKQDASTSSVPVIAISALRLNDFQARGSLTGFPELVSNGLPEEKLLKAVENEIGRSAAETGAERPAGAQAKQHARPKVLLADDQNELLMLMKETIEAAGFEVVVASDGQEAIKAIFDTRPDIAVLDYSMPAKDGLTVAQDLKNNPLFAHIPIIICTAYSEKKAKIKGLSMGIDDYLIKPVDTDELIARIRMILKRNKQVLDTNPLSKLPGNPSIQARVEREIQQGGPFAVLYLDLNNFKAYNDIYGFDAGDHVLKATANLLVKLTIENESSEDFIGHIGGDDFIIVTDFEKAEKLAESIVVSFDDISPSFYTKEDRERGYIVSTDRQNKVKQFPFLSIAVGIVHNKIHPLTSFAQVSNIGAELKKAAKSREKSSYIMDRRKE